MSRTALHTTKAGAGTGPKAPVSRATTSKQKYGTAKVGGSESIDLAAAQSSKNALPATNAPSSRFQSKKLSARGNLETGRAVSRLEILLAPKTPQRSFKPEEETPLSKQVNQAIKLAEQWTNVQEAVRTAKALSASNVAFAVYRLGCLYSFTSAYRKKELLGSDIVPFLLTEAQLKLHQMDAGSVTLLLDGCARLELKPAEKLMTALANLVHSFALSFEASQLPLVLWAFTRLKFVPRGSTLASLDNAADKLAPNMSPQGIALILSGFQAAGYVPSQRTLHRISESVQRQLATFKASEVAASLEAFSAFDYQPNTHLLLAVAKQFGQSVHSNIVTGKPALSHTASSEKLETAESAVPHPAKLVEHGSKAAASQIAAAGRMIRQVSQRVGENVDSALGPPVAPPPLSVAGHTLRKI